MEDSGGVFVDVSGLEPGDGSSDIKEGISQLKDLIVVLGFEDLEAERAFADSRLPGRSKSSM